VAIALRGGQAALPIGACRYQTCSQRSSRIGGPGDALHCSVSVCARCSADKATAVIGRTGVRATSFVSRASSRAAKCRADQAHKLAQTSGHKIEPYQSSTSHLPYAKMLCLSSPSPLPHLPNAPRRRITASLLFYLNAWAHLLWLRRAIRFDFHRRAEAQAAFVWGSQRCAIRKNGAASQSWVCGALSPPSPACMAAAQPRACPSPIVGRHDRQAELRPQARRWFGQAATI
jgi:hypothetical protein